MAAETRIKLANIITRLPEEAVDSLYETACKMFENHPDDERPTNLKKHHSRVWRIQSQHLQMVQRIQQRMPDRP